MHLSCFRLPPKFSLSTAVCIFLVVVNDVLQIFTLPISRFRIFGSCSVFASYRRELHQNTLLGLCDLITMTLEWFLATNSFT